MINSLSFYNFLSNLSGNRFLSCWLLGFLGEATFLALAGDFLVVVYLATIFLTTFLVTDFLATGFFSATGFFTTFFSGFGSLQSMPT